MIFPTLQRLIPPAAALLLAGCGMMRQGAMGLVAPVADNLAVSLQRQTDLQLVEDGVPALILLLDGLVLSAPDNTELRLAAADAYTAYAGAFTDPDDKARATELFGRAKTYALDVLSQNKRFKAALNDPQADFDAVVKTFRKRDVPALYAAATAWTGWIISNSDSVAATADISRAMALMQRVMDLDRGYRQGGRTPSSASTPASSRAAPARICPRRANTSKAPSATPAPATSSRRSPSPNSTRATPSTANCTTDCSTTSSPAPTPRRTPAS